MPFWVILLGSADMWGRYNLVFCVALVYFSDCFLAYACFFTIFLIFKNGTISPEINWLVLYTLIILGGFCFSGSSEKTHKGKEIGAAVSSMCSVPGGASQTLEFSLVWDMPVILFRSKEVQYVR